MASAHPHPHAPPSAQTDPPQPSPPAADLEGAGRDAADIDDVIAREIQYIRFHRHGDRKYADVRRSLVGLALSGGGIRSATTNLGILQALANMEILPMVDYLCTVSGGGYIGTCLSTLLSLNAARLPDTPNASPPRDEGDPHQFKPGDRPAFDTTPEGFPFRVGQTSARERRAGDLVAHLRTHGNFLIAHRGLLSRDTMRAIGNIVTGIVYNVLGFLLLLLGVSALYLTVASLLMPATMQGHVRPPASNAPFGVTRPDSVPGDSTLVRTRSVPCQPSDPHCSVQVSAPLVPPTGVAWLRYHLSNAGTEVINTWNGPWKGGPMPWPHPALRAFGAGLLLSIVAFFCVGAALLGYRRRWGHLARPNAGESQEDSFDRAALRSLSWLAFLVMVAVVLVLRVRSTEVNPVKQYVWLLAPLLLLLGARVGSFVITLLLPQFLSGQWTRRVRSLWGGYQAITIYGMWITLTFALLVPLMFAFGDAGPQLALGGVGSLIVARLLAKRTSGSESKLRLPAGLLRFLLALAVVATVGFGVVFFGAALAQRYAAAGQFLLVFAVATGIVVVMSFLVDQNKLSPHYFYRDRLAETYLLSEIPDRDRRLWVYRDAMEMPLHRLHGEQVPAPFDPMERTKPWCNPAPYHLISAAVNLAGSKDLTRKDRKSGYWLFSKLFCGSVHTGFRPTELYRRGETKVARAAATSGAAAASAMGFMTFFAQAFATVLFNVRLGCWLENPAHPWRSRHLQEGAVFWLWYIMKEVTMTTTENDQLVNLSDGGHTGDNIGIYPLLQRGCKIIIACDAEQDAALAFGSLTEVLRHAYVDLGISVDIDLSMIRPDPVTGRSRSHCAVGRIKYPSHPNRRSYLIYMKNSLTGDEQEPVLNYKVSHPSFPHETTADQFFSDAQFESYRALGVHIAETTFEGWIGSDIFTTVRDYHWSSPCPA